jgi:hypothetical protein
MDVSEKLVELIEDFVSYEYNTEELVDELTAHGVTVQEWISVKDRLPPYNHDVLVYRPNMATRILVDCYAGYYGEDDDEWYEGLVKYGKDIHNNPIITHWAYLPQPPKGE